MCGVSGFLLSRQLSKAEPKFLQCMIAAISYRGPDDSGAWYNEKQGIALGHARLAIVDLSSAGHQPMTSAGDRFVIAFNGEIYNHLDLRDQLESQGSAPSWRGYSDTETLLACFSAWGVEATLKATVGMFALALWDKQAQQLTLARDRLGEKPLYWGWCGDTLLFGSELKALKAHPAFDTQVDRGSLSLLLRYNYIPAPYTIYQGIEKLPAGQYVQIKKGQLRADVQLKAYWQLNQSIERCLANPFSGTDTQAADLLEQTISQAVSGQMLSDVPLGAFLSGGVDSSTVVALMQQQSKQPVRTFAIGFDEPGYNEAEYAKEVARYLGTDHTELYVSAQDAVDLVPHLPDIYCEPFADSSQLPTFLVSRMAKQHVTVALSGDGGDELFGGYNPYQFAPRVWSKLQLLPLPLRQIASRLLSGLPLPDKLAKLLRVLPAKDQEQFYRILMSHWDNPGQLVIGGNEYPTLINSAAQWPKTDCFEHWMMAMDAGQYMIDDILVKVDRAAMANSLETRVPLLDHRVVELAWKLPLHMKIRGGVSKWVLREVLYRHVPREMIERPKKGFSVPLGQWLRGPLRDWAEALLNEQRLEQDGYLNSAVVRRVWSDHLQGKRDHSLKLWSILMFQAWLEKQWKK
ncbi:MULTISPECIES: asparagine synthase (glutamine-hydrolyzing) [Aeromonas]|uniref:asparagine synthase (glutamine-hydrolyzing) n=1 Tax=Aeromonas hydrophila TaxID=644 RepID=A0ABD7GAS2_AERHY|nr:MULTISPECIES: asparagine synthase (glutamine-hydrolyzing) [Aeromonas]AUZ74447.1 asparagine synthase (glutamine-hydrolyzing) [Aeromonas sp. ASNIH4]MCV9381980.1 asparagine synthase (glutamine-hydrolyzing) [Aeromonas hydrophila]POU33578.1 asparagine synthase (glutamine-hydrolyzing) [Aeromonas hydrophila]POV86072.1 asparagine synthase (glutamine-hydrolyzing) [Aeromonas sp. ASNIH6]RCF51153.1 asparagine synthase (glutamine-hydrolyzing) [Aeromonas hydrophila]